MMVICLSNNIVLIRFLFQDEFFTRYVKLLTVPLIIVLSTTSSLHRIEEGHVGVYYRVRIVIVM